MVSARSSQAQPLRNYRVVHLTLLHPIDSHTSRHVIRLIKRNRDCAIALRAIRDHDYLEQFCPRFYLPFIAPRRIFIRATYEINTFRHVDRSSAGAWIKIPPPNRRTLISSFADVCVTRRSRYRVISVRAFSHFDPECCAGVASLGALGKARGTKGGESSAPRFCVPRSTGDHAGRRMK